MNQILPFNNSPEQLAMSSREIAELIEKRHDHIKVSAERLAAKGVIGTPATREFIHNGNTYTEYLFNKRDSLILVAQNCPEFTARIVDRWQELEAKAAKPAAPALPHDYISALEHLLVSEKGRLQAVAALDQATAQLTIAAPKAEALDRLAKADGDLCITNTAKALGMRPKDLFAYMTTEKWIFRRAGGRSPVAYQNRIQSGYLTHKVTTVERSDGTEKTVEQVLVTPKGLAKLTLDLNKQPKEAA